MRNIGSSKTSAIEGVENAGINAVGLIAGVKNS
jgi:hypothetical protein